MKKNRRAEFKKSVKEQVKDYQGYIKGNKRLLKFLKYIPNLDEFPGNLGAFFDGEIHFDTPWDNASLEKIKATIVVAGWECISDESAMNHSWRRIVFLKKIKISGKRFWEKKTHQLRFYVYGKISMDGATCVRVQIGEKEEMQTTPIYEVVCEEGAAEMVVENV